jgi:preprotein translocase subunit YajC
MMSIMSVLAQESGGNPLVGLLPLLLLGAVFYFVLIRPQQRRARAQQELVRSAEVGDDIVLTSGIYGSIVDIDDDEDIVTVEIAPGTRIRMVRAGIGRRLVDEAEEYDEAEGYEEDDEEAGDEGTDGQEGSPGTPRDQQGPSPQR